MLSWPSGKSCRFLVRIKRALGVCHLTEIKEPTISMEMFRKVFFSLLAFSFFTTALPQVDAREKYENFRQKAVGEYVDFRKKANLSYANFMRRAWGNYQQMLPIPKPKEEVLPPIAMPKEDRDNPIGNNPIHIEDVVVPPMPQPQPRPISPIREQPQLQEDIFNFTFYGIECKVRFPLGSSLSIAQCDKGNLANAWEILSEKKYDNTIRDCLALREQCKLCDWAYIKLLKHMSELRWGKTNEATLLTAYIYCQSGYDIKLGVSNGCLCLLYASRQIIYDQAYYTINGKHYYPLENISGSMSICDASFPEEKPLDLSIQSCMSLTYSATPERTIQSKRFPELKAIVRTNKNLLDFYSSYPSSMANNDFMTRWAFYANTPLEEIAKEGLYGCLKPMIEGLDSKEAVERLLNFVQTGFDYEYDNNIWGCDRAFFAEETLFYPFCDCEDRSILFSRIVRDLLGLKVVLVYYPGHLATAVEFPDSVQGDYITIDNDRYTICDPTYIDAPVGRTMPGMQNAIAKAIILK